MMQTRTQRQVIIGLLKRKWTTPLDALKACGCLNFGARINEIRKAHKLKEMWVDISKTTRVKAFRMDTSRPV